MPGPASSDGCVCFIKFCNQRNALETDGQQCARICSWGSAFMGSQNLFCIGATWFLQNISSVKNCLQCHLAMSKSCSKTINLSERDYCFLWSRPLTVKMISSPKSTRATLQKQILHHQFYSLMMSKCSWALQSRV